MLHRFSWQKRVFLASTIIVGLLGGLLVACSGPSLTENFTPKTFPKGDSRLGKGLSLKESDILLHMKDGIPEFSLPIQRTETGRVSGKIILELADLRGKSLQKIEKSFVSDDKDSTKLLKASMSSFGKDLEQGKLGNYILKYQLIWSGGTISGRRSLAHMIEQVELQIIGHNEWLSGEDAFLRIFVKDPKSQKPIANAPASLEFFSKQIKGRTLFTGKTNAAGVLNAKFTIPQGLTDTTGSIQARVTARGNTFVKNIPMTFPRERKVLVTTDKPTYQPGQTIHIRALAMEQPKLAAAAGKTTTIEIFDAKNNKVHKSETKTNDYGVAYNRFQLANELNQGIFRIVVKVDGKQVIKTVKVEEYTLPKFKVTLQTAKSAYKPGEEIKGQLQAMYFFGKKVTGKVSINFYLFDDGSKKIHTLHADLDNEGHYAFSFKTPSTNGSRFRQGRAYLRLDIKVHDSAKQEVTLERQIPITSPFTALYAVSEHSVLIPNKENILYVLATTPTGIPVETQGTILFHIETIKGNRRHTEKTEPIIWKSGKNGVAIVRWKAPKHEAIHAELRAGEGGRSFGRVTFTASGWTDKTGVKRYLYVKSDKVIYKPGETAKITLSSNITSEKVFLDVHKAKRHMGSRELNLQKGQTTIELAISEKMAGPLQLNAYAFLKDGKMLQSGKLMFVDIQDGLQVSVKLDKETYRPAEKANLVFEVKDAHGKPARAALGVQVVDEAVFARTEFRPGLARLFFKSNSVLATKSSKVRQFDANQLLHGGGKMDAATRQLAAKILFASMTGIPYNVKINTYHEFLKGVSSSSKGVVNAMMQEFRELVEKSIKEENLSKSEFEHFIKSIQGNWFDPWGQPYGFTFKNNSLVITSLGPDEKSATSDDIRITLYFWHWDRRNHWDEAMPNARGGPGGMQKNAGRPTQNGGPPQKEPSASGGEAPRIRSFFPETLAFAPSLVTDVSGKATLELPLADSITTWRMSVLGSSQSGQLGSTTSGIRVFQPFFVDLNMPLTYTRNDEITLPIVVYNYLKQAQDVRLQVQKASWFDLLEAAEKTVHLKSGEVRSVSFKIRLKRFGYHKFTVFAYGDKEKDAIARGVTVVPNGKKVTFSVGDFLDKPVKKIVQIPNKAIDGSQKMFVKIYPGILSQVIEGLEGMLRQPHGCFEQTSTTTYPNALILDYMKKTGKINKKIAGKATKYLSLGYQRLVSFEVPGGGFEWFGKTPAHVFLTAYGLFEFFDMAKVHPVDANLIKRTQTWLANQQKSDGTWASAKGYDYWGSFGTLKLSGTAYVLWSLAETGYKGAAIQKAVNYLKGQYKDEKNPYIQALVANALLSVNGRDALGLSILKALNESKSISKTTCHWKTNGQTLMYGGGRYANTETTALVMLAMLKADGYDTTVQCAVNGLVQTKKSSGHWGTTQATIQALRALIAALSKKSSETNASIGIKWGDKEVKTLQIDKTNRDLMQQVDLSAHAILGDNPVTVGFVGQGMTLYQITGSYYLPWKIAPKPNVPLPLDVKFGA